MQEQLSFDSIIKRSTEFLQTLLDLKDYIKNIQYDKNDERKRKIVHDFRTLTDISLIFAICNCDLVICGKGLNNKSERWQQVFFIKNIYLIIYETINALNKYNLFLKEQSKISPLLEESFIQINKALKQFKREYNYQEEIIKVRNKIAGHIHDDLEEYFQIITHFDNERSQFMALKFMYILAELQQFFADLNNIERKAL